MAKLLPIIYSKLLQTLITHFQLNFLIEKWGKIKFQKWLQWMCKCWLRAYKLIAKLYSLCSFSPVCGDAFVWSTFQWYDACSIAAVPFDFLCSYLNVNFCPKIPFNILWRTPMPKINEISGRINLPGKIFQSICGLCVVSRYNIYTYMATSTYRKKK